MADTVTELRRILQRCRTIAVVGLSAEWHRPSYFAAKYMQEHGYRIVPGASPSSMACVASPAVSFAM